MPYTCPSPDDCEFTTDDISELATHVTSEHSGEYRRSDWPDTDAGRRTRASRFIEDDEE